jgi:hypothetical protein
MMRGVQVELPAAAKLKLQELQLQRDACQDILAGVASRSRNADPSLVQRLTAEREKFQHRFSELSRLLSACNQWLAELKGDALEPSPTVSISVKNGETLNEALNNIREEVRSLQQQLVAVRSAPLPKEDQKKACVAYVAQLMRTARPTIGFVRDTIKVNWHDDVITSRTDALALLAWIAPEQVLAALEREIDQLPASSSTMSRSKRIERIAELEAAIDRFERAEAALVERARSDGLDVLHRPTISPAAFLNVITVAKEVPKPQAA